MQALWFVNPLLLIGVLAAGVPFLLHLLSSVRARDVPFPTLRFLRISMDKTARRRRIQHWLLLVLRAALLALLAVAVAEPISRATSGWGSRRNSAAVVILDNSMSMAVKAGGGTRFSRAQARAGELLGGDEKPTLAAVIVTNAPDKTPKLTAKLEQMRDVVSGAKISYQRAPIAACVSQALEILAAEKAIPQKAIYVFSDMQRVSFEDLLRLDASARSKGVHVLFVDAGGGPVNNVGISGLEIAGRGVVHEALEFTAVLENSSPVDSVVSVAMRVGGRRVTQPVQMTLRAAGKEGSRRAVRFQYAFDRVGPASGEVYLDLSDDLPADDVRRFAVTVGEPISALVVRGPADPSAPPELDAGRALRFALDPFGDPAAPWPVRSRTVNWEKLATADLAATDIVFLTDVPALNDAQGRALAKFVSAGGTAVVFLGPSVRPQSYNRTLGGILPAALDEPTGEVGPDAPAVRLQWLDLTHPYFVGLFGNRDDYPASVVWRRYLVRPAAGAEVYARLSDGEPLLLGRPIGKGRSVLCTTSASPRWSIFSHSTIFVPLVLRMSLQARRGGGRDQSYPAGAQVTISPKGFKPSWPRKVQITYADDTRKGVPLKALELSDKGSVVFTDTSRPGVYRWRVAGPGKEGAAGRFVVNPHGAESRLAGVPPEQLEASLRRRGFEHVYVGRSVAEAVAAAARQAQGKNWWDYLAALVIVILVIEAIIANHMRRRSEAPQPAPAA